MYFFYKKSALPSEINIHLCHNNSNRMFSRRTCSTLEIWNLNPTTFVILEHLCYDWYPWLHCCFYRCNTTNFTSENCSLRWRIYRNTHFCIWSKWFSYGFVYAWICIQILKYIWVNKLSLLFLLYSPVFTITS